jgi:hypothetical protein
MQFHNTKRRLPYVLFVLAILFLIGITSVSTPASAERVSPYFEVNYKTLENNISAGGSALYNITIQNKQDFEDEFYFSVPDIHWSPQTVPPYHYTSGVDIPPEENMSITLYMKSRSDMMAGTHYVEFITKSQVTNKEMSNILPIIINQQPEEPKEVPTKVSLSVTYPNRLIGGNTYPLRIIINNQNEKNITNTTLDIENKLLTDSSQISIPSFENRTIEYTIAVPNTTETANEPLTVTLSHGGDVIAQTKRNVQLVAREYEIEKSVEQKNGLFSKTITIDLYNPNQKGRDAEVRFEQTSPDLFTSYNYAPNLETTDDTVGWVLHVPGEGQQTITIRTNYLPLVIVVILLLAAGAGYLLLSSPVSINKKVISQSCTGSGNVCTIKIQLSVTNKTNKEFTNVTITDVLPYLGHYEKQETLGTLPPQKVLRYNNETYLKWKLDTLEPHEERVFAYTMSLKLSIVGSFFLKPALIKLGTKNIFSNKIIINNSPSQ